MTRASEGRMKERRARVFEGIVAGKTLRAIATEEGVSDTTITADVRAITDALGEHAVGELRATLALAIANYQRVIDAAWTAYDEAWTIQRAWLAGQYDRDGGEKGGRQAPSLKLEMAAYLDKIIAATRALTKMAGVEGADELRLGNPDGSGLNVTIYIPDNGRDSLPAPTAES